MQLPLMLGGIGQSAGFGISQQPRNAPHFNIPRLQRSSPEMGGKRTQPALSGRIDVI
jgi:hypothetical protein